VKSGGEVGLGPDRLQAELRGQGLHGGAESPVGENGGQKKKGRDDLNGLPDHKQEKRRQQHVGGTQPNSEGDVQDDERRRDLDGAAQRRREQRGDQGRGVRTHARCQLRERHGRREKQGHYPVIDEQLYRDEVEYQLEGCGLLGFGGIEDHRLLQPGHRGDHGSRDLENHQHQPADHADERTFGEPGDDRGPVEVGREVRAERGIEQGEPESEPDAPGHPHHVVGEQRKEQAQPERLEESWSERGKIGEKIGRHRSVVRAGRVDCRPFSFCRLRLAMEGRSNSGSKVGAGFRRLGAAMTLVLAIGQGQAAAETCSQAPGNDEVMSRLAAARETLAKVQAMPLDGMVVGEVGGRGFASVVDPKAPVVVPRVGGATIVPRRLGRMVVIEGNLARGSGRPSSTPAASPKVAADYSVGFLRADVGMTPAVERLDGDRSVLVLPSREPLRIAGGCIGSMIVAPSIGGVIVVASGAIEVEQGPEEVLVRAAGAVLSLSPCCADPPKPVPLISLKDMFDSEAVIGHLRHARLRLDMPADRSSEMREWLEHLQQGRFDEARAISEQFRATPYGRAPVVQYLAHATEIGRRSRGRATGAADLLPSSPALPGTSALNACLAADKAEGPVRTAAASPSRAELTGLPKALREMFLRCRVAVALRTGDFRAGLDALREIGPIEGDDASMETQVENVLLLNLAGEASLAGLYRERLEEKLVNAGLSVALARYRWLPDVETIFGAGAVVEQLMVRRVSFGDPTLDAAMLARALDQAPPQVVAAALRRHTAIARVFADERLRSYLLGRLARRVNESFAPPQASMPLPLVLSLLEFSNEPGLGDDRFRLKELFALRALEIGAIEASMSAFVDLTVSRGKADPEAISAYVRRLVEARTVMTSLGDAIALGQEVSLALRVAGAVAAADATDRALKAAAASHVALSAKPIIEGGEVPPDLPELSILEEIRRIDAKP